MHYIVNFNRVHLPTLEYGDEFIVFDPLSPVKIGDTYNDWNNAKIIQIYYSNENKKWFEFWKRKKQQGYLVRWEEPDGEDIHC